MLRIFMQMNSDIATCMYYTGIDPFTKQEFYIAKALRDREMRRALMQQPVQPSPSRALSIAWARLPKVCRGIGEYHVEIPDETRPEFFRRAAVDRDRTGNTVGTVLGGRPSARRRSRP